MATEDETGALGQYTPDRSASGTLGALNASVAVRVTGRAGVGQFLSTSDLVATVVPEVSFDGGTSYSASAFLAIDVAGVALSTSEVYAGTPALAMQTIAAGGGATHVRVRVSAYTSGTATVRMAATALPGQAMLATVNGGKLHNFQIPLLTDVGVLGGLANAAEPVLTEGNQVLFSTDLAGRMRSLVTFSRPATSTLTNVAASASSVTVLASSATRRGASFYNDSTAACYLKMGITASTSSFTVKILGGGFYEIPQPCYTGRLDAIWDSATGNMRVTELT